MARGVKFITDPKSDFGQSFLQDFEILNVLGKGAFSVVKRCRGKHSIVKGKEFAVKIIKSSQLTSKNRLKLDKEERICKTLKHPNIVSLHYSYKDGKSYCLVLDLVVGGELFEDIIKREYYSETDASKCLRQILQAIQFCHDNNIVHRDIKPENLLLSSKTPPVDIKLADFGLAVELESEELAWYGFAGTPGYISPEVVNKAPYGKPIDLWACGIILYILLVGYPPFWHEDQQKLYALIRRGEYEFASPEWDTVTHEAKELIHQLLQVDQRKRLTAKEALKHSWVFMPDTASKFHRQKTIEVLKSFNAKGKFKAAVFSTILSNQLIRGLASQKDVANKNTEQTELTPELVLSLTQKLIDAISARDWDAYTTLCDEQLTCFEPETRFQFVQGLQFHKYYFDNPTLKISSFENTIENPKIKIFQKTNGSISFLRKTELVLASDERVSLTADETRVWSKIGQFWKCIHFHRS